MKYIFVGRGKIRMWLWRRSGVGFLLGWGWELVLFNTLERRVGKGYVVF